MSNLFSKSWFLAVLALIMTLGTQAVAYLLYCDELFPKPKDILVIKPKILPQLAGVSPAMISRI